MSGPGQDEREAEGPDRALWQLRLRDRPGSLERLLGVLRKRRVAVEELSMERSEPSILHVRLRLGLDADRRDRIRAEVEGLADVETDHNVSNR